MLILAGLIKSKLLETVNIRAHPELIVMYVLSSSAAGS